MASDLACEDPFDSIDDLLDFPNEDDGRLSMVDAWGNCAPMAPSLAPAMIVAGSGGGINTGNVSGDEISSENDALGLYNEADITNLEWLSNFFEGCEFNADLIPNAIAPSSSSSSSSSSSPSSSSSSSSSCSPGTGIPGRARTKRARLPSLSALGFVAPRPSASPSPWAKKAKKEGDSPAPSARKCAHCEIQKTPQWRAGPTGPKTLCNACGVRYKSGRLFPEYRPAASPTFVPAVHSNSHKRVVEMRLRAAPCDLLHFLPARD